MMWWKRLKKHDPEKEKKLKEDIEKDGGLEKHDLGAMVFSALLVILPVALLVLLVLALFAILPILLA